MVIYDRIREMLRRFRKLPMPGAQCIGKSDLVALRYHARHGFAGPTGAAVRRAGDPQLHCNHDVWRRTGRHLYVGIASPILIYLGVGAGRDLSAPDRDK